MLWIMRHADAGRTTDQPNDNQRPLTPLGRDQATNAGKALRALQAPIQQCLTSTLTRASQTAELACAHLNITPQPAPQLDGYPTDPDWLKHLAATTNTLIVTHMPAVQLAVHQLTGAQIRYPKAGIAQIHQGELWALIPPSLAYTIAGAPIPAGDPMTIDHRHNDPADQRLRRDHLRHLRNIAKHALLAPRETPAAREQEC